MIKIFFRLFFVLIFFNMLCAKNSIDSIKDAIKSRYEQTYPTIKIDNISLFIKSSINVDKLKVLSLNLDNIKAPQGYIKIKYSIDDSEYEDLFKYTMNAKIIAYKAVENIKTNQNITKDLISMQTLDFNNINSNVASLKDILDSSAKNFITANSIIYTNRLSPKILVYKDADVTILLKESGISVTQKGKAMQNGIKNDRIKVQNISSKKILDGVVVGENLVNIE